MARRVWFWLDRVASIYSAAALVFLAFLAAAAGVVAVGGVAAALFGLAGVFGIVAVTSFARSRGWIGPTGWRSWQRWLHSDVDQQACLGHYDGKQEPTLRCRIKAPGLRCRWITSTEIRWAPDHVAPPDPHYYTFYPKDFPGAPALPIPRGVYSVRWYGPNGMLARDSFRIPPW